MQIFNNREFVIIILGLLFLTVLFFSKKVRQSVIDLLHKIFIKEIVTVFSTSIIYTTLCIWILWCIGFWDIALLKPTLTWIFFVSFTTIFKSVNNKENKNLLLDTFRDNFKFTIILEFIIGLYSFSLGIEFLILPLALILSLIVFWSDNDNESIKLKKYASILSLILGALILIYSLVQVYYHYKEINVISTLKDFILPPLLSFLFIPFIYLLTIYVNYELCFKAIGNKIKSIDLLKFTKKQVVINFNVNLKALHRWQTSLFMLDVNSKHDILNSINVIKDLFIIEKNPPHIDASIGWSPYYAKNLLDDVGITTGYYNNCYEDEWFACSNYIKLDNEILSNNISYYVNGNANSATSLKLILNINNKSNASNAHEKLLKYSKQLYMSVFKKDMPYNLQKSILEGSIEIEEYIDKKVAINKESWINDNGYNIGFEIIHLDL